jgi:hypothetical protein
MNANTNAIERRIWLPYYVCMYLALYSLRFLKKKYYLHQ